MFEPLRFNKLLRAVPGLQHLQFSKDSATHKYKDSEELKKVVDVDKVHTAADGQQVRTHTRSVTDVAAQSTSASPAHAAVAAAESQSHATTHAHGHTSSDDEQHSKTETTHTHTSSTADVALQPATASHGAVVRVKGELDVTSVETNNADQSTTLSHVHATVVGAAVIEMTPPHPPREETPLYEKTHHHLVFTQDSPCAICGVKNSTLGDPKQNLFGAKDIETHHYPLERCLVDACDPTKVSVVFPQVKDRASLEAFIDSEANMMVLCDVHHRHPFYGIHHLVGPDFYVQPFLYGGYQIVADKDHEAETIAADEKIVRKHVSVEEITHGLQGEDTKVVKETVVTRTTTHRDSK